MSVIVLYFWRYFTGFMWSKYRCPFLEKPAKTLLVSYAGDLWALCRRLVICQLNRISRVSKGGACLKGKLKFEFFLFSSPVNLICSESYDAGIKIILGRVV